MRDIPGEWDRQSCGSKIGPGRECSRRAVSGEVGSSGGWEIDLVDRSRSGQRTVKQGLRCPGATLPTPVADLLQSLAPCVREQAYPVSRVFKLVYARPTLGFPPLVMAVRLA